MSAVGERVADPSSPRPVRLAVAYVLLLVAAVVLFLAIRAWGERRAVEYATGQPAGAVSAAGQVAAGPSAAPAHSADPLSHVLLALATIMVTGRLLGVLFQRVGQPRVIGEVVAGILLGPSFLGRLWPEATAFLLPPAVAPALGLIAQLGIILYMFLVGLELNSDRLRSQAHATVAISHASIVVPFVLGAALALGLHERLAPPQVSFTSFAMFLGVAMSITAFPVLARILTDRGLEQTELGVIALTCAAADDVTAWCLLAGVIGVAQSEFSGVLRTAALAAGYLLLMLVVVRPWIQRWVRGVDQQGVTAGAVAWVLAAVLASSLSTQAIGVHAVFGAFLLGALIPHDSLLARSFRQRLEDLVTMLLLPAFFALTGMRTQIGLVSGWTEWLICGAIIGVATVGKFGGTLAAARFTGLGWRTSAALGILMNTRGLMELIVLNIGLDLGVISPTLFAMMVLMALVTTVITTPILSWLTLPSRPATASA